MPPPARAPASRDAARTRAARFRACPAPRLPKGRGRSPHAPRGAPPRRVHRRSGSTRPPGNATCPGCERSVDARASSSTSRSRDTAAAWASWSLGSESSTPNRISTAAARESAASGRLGERPRTPAASRPGGRGWARATELGPRALGGSDSAGIGSGYAGSQTLDRSTQPCPARPIPFRRSTSVARWLDLVGGEVGTRARLRARRTRSTRP